MILYFCYQGTNKAGLGGERQGAVACQLHGAECLRSSLFSDVSNLHLNVLTNFDPIMSKLIGTVWEEMTAPPAEIATVRIPQGDDLMPESAGAVRIRGQIMTRYAGDGPARTGWGGARGWGAWVLGDSPREAPARSASSPPGPDPRAASPTVTLISWRWKSGGQPGPRQRLRGGQRKPWME